MKHLFVSYELALKLKEKGFHEHCLRAYCERYKINSKTGGDIKTGKFYLTDKPSQKSFRCLAPLYQQVIDWFREKYGIHLYVDHYGEQYVFAIKTIEDSYYNRYGSYEMELMTYYEALNKAIEEALKLV